MKFPNHTKAILIALIFFCNTVLWGQNSKYKTGISGVYEVVHAVEDMPYSIQYWAQYGFTVIDSAHTSQEEAKKCYGVASELQSYRLQNGDIDSHGLLRLWKWKNPSGPGVGYSEPETIGSRMSVMKTNDIMRIYDVYDFLRQEKKPWLPTEPITDDLFGLNKGNKDFINRPILVRENAVYGEYFNHVFFQRYGYEIPGYGTIHPETPLKTSEFTHHDWIIPGKNMEALRYLTEVLGLKAENAPEINGDWQKGPKRVFMMKDGYTHIYQGFVSPNNICGKLKFFIPLAPKPDRSDYQQLGQLGTTMHTFFAPDINVIRNKAIHYPGLTVGEIIKNEFGEHSFLLKDSVGITWQIIEKKDTKNKPETTVKFIFTNN